MPSATSPGGFCPSAIAGSTGLARQAVLFGHRVEAGIRVGPAGMMATRRGLQLLHGDLTAIVRLADLANLYDKPIAASTWEVIRREAARLPEREPSPEACRQFLSLLGHPARLVPILRDLHDAGILERFIPDFRYAWGLLQFNQYHKYTVDEHCIRAVELPRSCGWIPGRWGRVYRPLMQKYLLHLALLDSRFGQGPLGRPLRPGHANRGRHVDAAWGCLATKSRP